MEQATEPPVVASLREQRSKDNSSALVCSDANGVLVQFTDRIIAKLIATADFNSSVLRAGEASETRNNPSGTLVYHHASSRRPKSTARLMVVPIISKKHLIVLVSGDQ